MKKLKIIPDTSKDLEEVIKKAGEENLDHNSWWYLHGDLEEMCGYDKATIYNMSEFPETEYRETLKWSTIIGDKTTVQEFIPLRRSYLEGIYPVKVYGVEEECLGYFWVTNEREITATLEESPEVTRKFNLWDQLGLVVLKSDEYGNMYARERYKEHSSYL